MGVLQSWGTSGHAASIDATSGSSVGAGHSIVVAVAWDSQTEIVSVADDNGNTYSSLQGPNHYSGASVSTQYFIAQNVVGGAVVKVTVTDASGSQFMLFIAFEDDALALSPLDKHAGTTGSASTVLDSGATAATTQALELVIGFGANESGSFGTVTPGTGYTLERTINDSVNGQAVFLEYLEVTSTGTQDATTVSTSPFAWSMDCVTLKRNIAPQVVQQTLALSTSGGLTSQSATLNGVTGGNTLVVIAAVEDAGLDDTLTLTVSDGVNTYTQRGTNLPDGSVGRMYLWDSVGVASGNTTVTVTASGTATLIWVAFLELPPCTFDQEVDSGSSNVSASPYSGINITPGAAPGLCVACIFIGNFASAPTYAVSGGLLGIGSGMQGTNTSAGGRRWAMAVATEGFSATTGITPTWTFSPDGSFGGSIMATYTAGASGSSISGNAGVAGALVSYTGTASGNVTADGSGNYTIPGLANGSYTITPTKAGYTFSPSNRSETVSSSNITGVDFTATPVSGGTTSLLLIISD